MAKSHERLQTEEIATKCQATASHEEREEKDVGVLQGWCAGRWTKWVEHFFLKRAQKKRAGKSVQRKL